MKWSFEYKKISQSFKEFNAEEESCATSSGLAVSSAMQAALSKLETKNAELRSRSVEMLYENQRLADMISSWTKSSVSLQKLQGAIKPYGDKTGLGYNSNEGKFKAEEESCATSSGLSGSSAMQAALSKLETKNAELRSRSVEMLYENQRLADMISSWTKSSVSLQKLQGAIKPYGDKTGLGYNSNEGSITETSSLKDKV
ncbi:hypothetical protein F511_32624 [Dorcoceras hygrometricum]|uniref:Spindle pole body component 110-like n=1 Tax=Dorcoceras hygrometricum TaxID=472368 RepID=A0A2Z7C1H6_9LAMI|nr:hypothetical protein F511_32624 [Dorcoceras hygrometricum]